jgi:hypothetical protein
MTTKTDIKKLLSKGLTGKEAGKLLLMDNWQVDHRREGFLSDKDISAMKASLKTPQDIKDYNSYVDLYRLVDYTLKDAKILSLEAQNWLQLSSLIISRHLEKHFANVDLLFTPAIVTQKQYDELSSKLRKLLLLEPHSLEEVIISRAQILSPKQYDEWEASDTDLSEIAFFYTNYPDKWSQALSEILELVKSGKLRPVLVEDQKVYTASSWRRGQFKPFKKAEETLERLQKDFQTIDEEEEDKILSQMAFIGEDLYKAGLPEWIEWIDEYKPDLIEGTMARPEGMMQSVRVAIVQNPQPYEVDERGYWIEKGSREANRELNAEEDSKTIESLIYSASERIKAFLSIKAVTEVISEMVGVNFLEDIEEWLQAIEVSVSLFNTSLDSVKTLGIDLPKMKPIKLGQMKPTASSIKYYKERMGLALGSDWYSTAVRSLEYEAEEPDSLAQEFIDELKEALAKERRDGKA